MKNPNIFNYDEEDSPYGKASEQSNTKTIFKIVALILGLATLTLGTIYVMKNNTNTLSQSSQGENHLWDMGEIVVNLANSSVQNHFLKVDLSIDLNNPQDTKAIQSSLPIIKDSFQIFLRELRIEDLSGSGGAFYIKTELLKRFNTIMYPIQAKDIFIKEIIVN